MFVFIALKKCTSVIQHHFSNFKQQVFFDINSFILQVFVEPLHVSDTMVRAVATALVASIDEETESQKE